MDAVQFLSRTVAPGNYLAVCYKRPDRRMMSQRFFPRDDVAEAAHFMRWCSNKGMDCWYAVASYVLATPDGLDGRGGQKYLGDRTQANAQALRCFWYDADIKRPGDNKTPAQAFDDWSELATWVQSFTAATSLPPPNLWVSSGYGAHLYWVLEDAIPAKDWMPLASAFKAALIASSAKGDVGLTSDSARILRPPETSNFKIPTAPAPTQVLAQLSRGDYPNDLMLQALQPYMGVAQQRAGNYSSGGLSGAPASVFAGRQPSSSPSAAAAQANMPARREHLFADIAKTCEQVKHSLGTGGATDGYPLWYLGFMTLAHFCSDGASYAHEISKGHPKYAVAGVDAALQQVANEQAAKGNGAPSCASFNAWRPGVCNNCKVFGGMSSPYSLGSVSSDLPEKYRRNNNAIEQSLPGKDGPVWVPLFDGDVYGPTIDVVGSTYILSFTYENAGKKFPVIVEQPRLTPETSRLIGLFGSQGVILYSHNAMQFGAFLVAWIEKLRAMRAERADPIPPFGWVARPDGTYNGFSVGGMLYRPDGGIEPAPGGDPVILESYRPRGSIAEWRTAADFVLKDRPDLQVLVAAGFAAPLIEFTGHSGFVISTWSRDSAVGKSSAFLVGTSIWADPKAMMSFDDTPMSVHYRIGKTKVMPAYWDEVRVEPEKANEFVNTLFKLGQGKDRSRLNSDTTLKVTGDWKTILITAGNQRLMDFVVQERPDTDAGALRLFEFQLEHPTLPLNTEAAQTIALAGKNAGNAGRVYAAWLAANSDLVKNLVSAMQTKIQMSLGAAQGERFFVAGIACIMVAATVATGLGLGKFDNGAMMAFLKDAFEKLRQARIKDLPTNNGVFNIERILAEFIAEHNADRLVTNHFRRTGPKDPTFNVVWAPRRLVGRLAVHVSISDQRMLIDKALWGKWCRNNRHSHTETFEQMELRWGARVSKGMIGAGTEYVTGSIYRIELPLTAPELATYVDDYRSTK